MPASAPTALLVEDERQIRRFVRTALEAEGWQVVEAETMKQGLIDAGTRKPDLVILDLGLPDGDGIDFIRDFRGWSSVPVIVLSARGGRDRQDRGARRRRRRLPDQAVRRRRAAGARARDAAPQERGHAGERRACSASATSRSTRRTAWSRRRGDRVHLTPIEYRLLTLLIANAGKVLTHRHLLREVWGPSYVESNHYVRIYVGHLRQKLEADPAQPRHLLTETGVGYRFQP